MFNIEAPGPVPQVAAQANQPKKGQSANTELSRTPPAQVVDPERAVPPAQQAEKAEPSRKEAQKEEVVQRLSEAISKFSAEFDTQIKFSVHDATDELVVQIIDQETEEVVRQIPAEDVLNRIENFDDLKGLLVSTEG